MKTEREVLLKYRSDNGELYPTQAGARFGDARHLLASLGYDREMPLDHFLRTALADPNLVLILKRRVEPQRNLL